MIDCRPEDWRPKDIAGLEPAALAAVKDESSALVVAGPGAGKTELLAQRASYLLETGICSPPYRILAISFKRDAARNLRERVARRIGSERSRRFESYTFDAWSKSLIDRFRLGLPEAFRPTEDYLLDKTFTYEAPLRERVLSICASVGIGAEKVHSADLESFFKEWVCERAIDPNAKPASGSKLALALALWKNALHSGGRSVLAFPMLAVLAELLLRTNPILLCALRRAYKYVFLDEFQDTTGSQYRLLHTAFHGSSSVITAVGDNKQRIMLWAGANVEVFDVFQREFKAQPHKLIMNYRSAPKLVAIQQNIIKTLDPDSPVPKAADDGAQGEGECRFLHFSDDKVEAQILAEMIAHWIGTDGVEPNEICILVRQTPDRYTSLLRQELEARGIVCRIQSEIQDLLAEPLAIAVVNAMRVCTSARAPKEWAELSQATLEMKGCVDSSDSEKEIIFALSAEIQALRPKAAAATTKEEIREVILGVICLFGESTFRRVHEQYLQTEYFESIISDLVGHLEFYRSKSANWPDALNAFIGIGCVPIMSIHKSKGLEFHSVILLGLEDYPFRNLSKGDGEEECNFFVAFSRAKKRVIFTTAGARTTRYGLRGQTRDEILRFDKLLAESGVEFEKYE